MTPRQQAEKWRSENPTHHHGYVIIYRGEVGGWCGELNAESAGYWKPGCMAVPQYRNSAMFMSAGDDGSGGATNWEHMNPAYEPV